MEKRILRPFPIGMLATGMIVELELLTFIKVRGLIYKTDVKKIYMSVNESVQKGPVFIDRGEDLYIPRSWITNCNCVFYTSEMVNEEHH
jgi:hypothetical protein